MNFGKCKYCKYKYTVNPQPIWYNYMCTLLDKDKVEGIPYNKPDMYIDNKGNLKKIKFQYARDIQNTDKCVGKIDENYKDIYVITKDMINE